MLLITLKRLSSEKQTFWFALKYNIFEEK